MSTIYLLLFVLEAVISKRWRVNTTTPDVFSSVVTTRNATATATSPPLEVFNVTAAVAAAEVLVLEVPPILQHSLNASDFLDLIPDTDSFQREYVHKSILEDSNTNPDVAAEFRSVISKEDANTSQTKNELLRATTTRGGFTSQLHPIPSAKTLNSSLFSHIMVMSPVVDLQSDLTGADALAKIVWHNLPKTNCQTAVITYKSKHPIVYGMLRMGYIFNQPMMIVDLTILEMEMDKVQRGFFENSKMTCRVLVVDVFTHIDSFLFRFLESSKLWNWPDTQVVFLGSKWDASILSDKALRHIKEPLYIKVKDFEKQGSKAIVHVYSRCLYCHQGRSKILFVSRFPLSTPTTKNIFPQPQQWDSFNGNLIRVTSYSYYPYMEFITDADHQGTKVIALDSMDKRIFDALAQRLNLTFEFHMPRDGLPGFLLPNGSWTGMMKDLFDGYVDMTSTTVISYDNYELLHLAVTVETDLLTIVTLLPQVLPRYLVIITPFTGDVWMYLLLIILLWGLSLWTLQKLWNYIIKKETMSLGKAFFYSWAVILDDPPPRPPTNASGQMLVGWWLVACLLITAAYRSALISHLTVESKTKPVDDFEDLLDRNNWRWAVEHFLLESAPALFFTRSTDPNIKKIYEKLEGAEAFEGLERIKGGSFAMFISRNRLKYLISLYQTDSYGQHPYHLSKTGYRITSDMGIGFRKGDPFGVRCSQLIQMLVEAGLNDYWISNVLEDQGRRVRMKKKTEAKQLGSDTHVNTILDVETGVILRMSHMLGVFLVYFGGIILSLASFIAEKNKFWL